MGFWTLKFLPEAIKKARSQQRALFGRVRGDETEPPEGVTRLTSSKMREVRWDKWVRRYRYIEGVEKNGKSVWNKFAPAPPDAPPERKKGGSGLKKR